MVLQRATTLITLSLASLLMAGTSMAQVHHGNGSSVSPAAVSSSTELTEGEVRRIDLDGQKVTLRHGEIKHLDMPPMTMVFHAGVPGMLDQLKVGDKIRFDVQERDGKMVLTRIAPSTQ